MDVGDTRENDPTETTTPTKQVTRGMAAMPTRVVVVAFTLVSAVSAAVSPVARTAAVVGAGPAGVCTAIMLARRGWSSITVYDELTPPPSADDPMWGAGERSYQLGINGRGQRALRSLGCMERVSRYAASANGRLSFDAATGAPVEQRLKPPGTPGAEKTYVTRVLQRDRLQACLLEEAAASYAGQIRVVHGTACEGLDLSGERPALLMRESGEAARREPVDLVVGADGVRSAVRSALEAAPGSRTRTVRFADLNERRFKTVPLHPSLVDGTSSDLNWGYRNKTLELGMDALPTMEGEMVAVLLTKPGTDGYRRIDALDDAESSREFFAECMPPLLPYLREAELERFAQRPIARLPSFQLVEGDVHRSLPSGGVVLLGDAIKAVKPYFGQGANSALEDVTVLDSCLAESDDRPDAACAAFTRRRAGDARALVRISRGFDRPGRIGTLRFILPLLIDLQLNKFMPWLFSPPMLRALQDERYAFAAILRRKRLERVLLVGMLGATFVALRAALRVSARVIIGA